MKHDPIVEPVVRLPKTLAFMLGAQMAPRSSIEALLEKAIAELDDLDGDPDREDALDTEDDPPSRFALEYAQKGPGCAIVDPGGCEHDGREVTGAEDDFMHHGLSGPGCPIADSGIADTGGLSEAHDCDGAIPIKGGGSGDY